MGGDHLGPHKSQKLTNKIIRAKIVHTSGTCVQTLSTNIFNICSYIQKHTQTPINVFKITIYNAKYTKNTKYTFEKYHFSKKQQLKTNISPKIIFYFVTYIISIIHILYILYIMIKVEIIRARVAEQRISVPVCVEKGGSAGKLPLSACLLFCLFVCLSVCQVRKRLSRGRARPTPNIQSISKLQYIQKLQNMNYVVYI